LLCFGVVVVLNENNRICSSCCSSFGGVQRSFTCLAFDCKLVVACLWSNHRDSCHCVRYSQSSFICLLCFYLRHNTNKTRLSMSFNTRHFTTSPSKDTFATCKESFWFAHLALAVVARDRPPRRPHRRSLQNKTKQKTNEISFFFSLFLLGLLLVLFLRRVLRATRWWRSA
jgi:hypothetical protein